MCQPDETPMPVTRQSRLRENLRLIAGALGVTIESLIEGARDGTYGDEAAELVRLWFSITDPADRRSVLEQVRKLAAKEA